jgi:hypothetical protein
MTRVHGHAPGPGRRVIYMIDAGIRDALRRRTLSVERA